MPSVTLKAHFNGSHVVFDEPASLLPNVKLLVTILPDNGEQDPERAEWLGLSASNLDAAYGNDEPEYSIDNVKIMNEAYDGR